MRAVLIGAEYEENLAVRYLAAAREAAGHEARIVPFSRAADLPHAVAACRGAHPDLIGLSMAFQHRAREFLELAAALRRDGFAGHLCAGGHVPTAAWSELLEHAPAIDTVVRHDGEVTLSRALNVRIARLPTAGDAVRLRAVPTHPSPRLSFVWTATAGTLSSTTAGEVLWTPPTGPGRHLIQVVVRDGERALAVDAVIEVR